MNNPNPYGDLLSAYCDGELEDQPLNQEISAALRNDASLPVELQRLILVKKAVYKTRNHYTISDKNREKILQSIRNEAFPRPSSSYRSYYMIAASIAAFFIMAAVYFQMASNSASARDLYAMANENFQKVMNGELAPEIRSSAASVVSDYLTEKGITYPLLIPECIECPLLGAVVTAERDSKVVHLIYKGAKGPYMYVIEASPSYFSNNLVISLNEEIKTYLDSGTPYKKQIGNELFVVWQQDGTICAAISQETEETVYRHFKINQ